MPLRLLLPTLLLLLTAALSARPARAQRFAAIGDYGWAGDAERDVAQLVKGWNPEFIITLGDNNYSDGQAQTIDANVGQYYHDFIGSYRGSYGPGAADNRFFPSIGNHDTHTGRGQPYLDYFTLPGNERYYDFVRGQVHFFVLNSDPTEQHGSTVVSRQARWLKARLAASKATWKVVYCHHAAYSSGSHGSSWLLRWPFRKWGASVVLSGHDHHYERLLEGGLPYIVNGLGGRSLYGLASQPAPGSLLRYNADYGAQLIEASADSLRLRFYTRTGKLIDSYTLRPGLSREPQLLGASAVAATGAGQVLLSLPEAGPVQLRLLDARRQEVAVLHQGPLPAGRRALPWTARPGLPKGRYVVELRSGTYAPVELAVLL